MTETLRETPLADLHRELGGRMVPFAGYAMPVQYPAGIMAEHLHCRPRAALFDVSHMGQAELLGAGGAAALEALTPADVAGAQARPPALRAADQRRGRHPRRFHGGEPAAAGGRRAAVPGGQCRQQGRRFRPHRGASAGRAAAAAARDRALLALQGPEAVAAIAPHAPGVAELRLHGRRRDRRCSACPRSSPAPAISGEDGVEISVPGEQAEAVARALLQARRRAAGRARRPRFAAAGGGPVPARQRHRRDDLGGRGRAHLVHRQAPPHGRELPRRRAGARRTRQRRRGAAASGCAPRAASRPGRMRSSRPSTARRWARSPRAASAPA